MSGGHGPSAEGSGNKYVALLIAMLALALAFSEMLGKNAEKASMQANIEASNLWAFFQAKTIRRAMAQNLSEMVQIDANTGDEARRAAIARQVDTWTKLAARLESEPDTNEGRRELMARAKAAETKRDLQNQKNEGFEIASAILQVGIVVASATIITGIAWLAYAAGGLGIVALALMAVAQFAPTILPFH